jgi:hypothetical protein
MASDEYVGHARYVAESLLSTERADFDLPFDAAIADVELDANDFAVELDILEVHGADAPVVELRPDEFIPVAFSVINRRSFVDDMGIGMARLRGTRPFSIWTDEVLRTLATRQDLPPAIQLVSRDTARAGFVRRVTRFLATRFAAHDAFRNEHWSHETLLARWRTDADPVPVPGCEFSVSAKTGGLRVLYSGAYRLVERNFGYPTSPVVATLQSGDYLFGVDGGRYGNDAHWDRAIVTLPGPPSVHLNY